MAGHSFPLRVVEIKQPNIGVRAFTFQSLDSTPFTYQPGQFFRVHVPATSTTKSVIRSYSLANPPGSDRLEISVDHVPEGIGCTYLFSLKEGDEVEASGFFGKLLLPPVLGHTQRMFLLATSTGVAPFHAMIPSLKALLVSHPELSVHIFEGVRTAERGLYVEDFVGLMQQESRFQFRLCVSREAPENTHPYLRAGYVQKQLNEFQLGSTDLIYLCGNPNMIDQSFVHCLDQGLLSAQVKREKYFA